MQEGGAGGRCGGAKRRQRNNSGPPWQTFRKLRGGGLVRDCYTVGTRTGREREDGVGGRHAGTETRDSQVGELPFVKDRDDGSETGDAQVVV